MTVTQEEYDILFSILETVFADGARQGGAYVAGRIKNVPEAKYSAPFQLFEALVKIEEK